MRIRFLGLLMILMYSNIYTQDSPIILGGDNSEGMFFYEYAPPLKIKAVYKDTVQAVNNFPEQLMQSIISAKSQKWVGYNTLGGLEKSDKKSQKHFEQIANMDIDKNFFVLHNKLEFVVEGVPTAIIKFYIHLEDVIKPISAAVVMQKKNNRWYKTSTTYTSRLSIMLMRLKSDKLKNVLTGSVDHQKEKELLKEITENKGISLDRLVNTFYGWYTSKNTDMLNYFIDEKAW